MKRCNKLKGLPGGEVIETYGFTIIIGYGSTQGSLLTGTAIFLNGRDWGYRNPFIFGVVRSVNFPRAPPIKPGATPTQSLCI